MVTSLEPPNTEKLTNRMKFQDLKCTTLQRKKPGVTSLQKIHVILNFDISSLSATKYHTPSYVVLQAHQYKLGAIFMAIAYLPRLCIPTPAALATYTQQLWLLLIPALRRPTGITCTTSVLIIPLHFRLLLGIDDILVVPHMSLL